MIKDWKEKTIESKQYFCCIVQPSKAGIVIDRLSFPIHIQILYNHGVGFGSVAIAVEHLSFNAAVASGLVDLTQGIPRSPLMPSQITTGSPPQGVVTLKFLNLMFSQTALGLQVRRATARPYLPDVYPEKFSKLTLLMLTWEGYCEQVVALIWVHCVSCCLFLGQRAETYVEVTRV